jgi:tmRNA-binding protein
MKETFYKVEIAAASDKYDNDKRRETVHRYKEI